MITSATSRHDTTNDEHADGACRMDRQSANSERAYIRFFNGMTSIEHADGHDEQRTGDAQATNIPVGDSRPSTEPYAKSSILIHRIFRGQEPSVFRLFEGPGERLERNRRDPDETRDGRPQQRLAAAESVIGRVIPR